MVEFIFRLEFSISCYLISDFLLLYKASDSAIALELSGFCLRENSVKDFWSLSELRALLEEELLMDGILEA